MDESTSARDFAMNAQPHSWLLVADNLFDQSVELYRRPSGTMRQLSGSGAVLGEWPSNNRSTFLLAGFALENAIKAFLVYENPSWIANGVLARPLRSHRLMKLSEQSTLIPWPKRGLPILSSFERGLESWARYPCALTAHGTEAEQNLSPDLWGRYLALMQVYGRSLIALLRKDWNGPHDMRVRFEINGSYLGAHV